MCVGDEVGRRSWELLGYKEGGKNWPVRSKEKTDLGFPLSL